MQFYSVVSKKSVEIPSKNIKEVTKSGRRFAVGTYEYKGKKYEAWRVLGAKSK